MSLGGPPSDHSPEFRALSASSIKSYGNNRRSSVTSGPAGESLRNVKTAMHMNHHGSQGASIEEASTLLRLQRLRTSFRLSYITEKLLTVASSLALFCMKLQTITLAAASSLENLQALAEVQDFATTDTGWTYRILPEPLLTAELARSSNALSGACFDSVTFQPCPYSQNQDRHTMESWDLPGGTWTFIAIFDGIALKLLHVSFS